VCALQIDRSDGVYVEFRHFQSEMIVNSIAVHSQRSGQRLDNPLNFCRFFMHDLFPQLHKIIYVDSDILVLGNIRELWDMASFPRGEVVAAIERPDDFYSGMLDDEMALDLFLLRYNRTLDPNDVTFNAGAHLT
jgi:lipopolysaccharide biosynthesis glycosyltransferase